MVGRQELWPSGHCYFHHIIKPYPYRPNQCSGGAGDSTQDRVKEDELAFSYSDLKLIPNGIKDSSNSKATVYPNEMGNPSHRSHPLNVPRIQFSKHHPINYYSRRWAVKYPIYNNGPLQLTLLKWKLLIHNCLYLKGKLRVGVCVCNKIFITL